MAMTSQTERAGSRWPFIPPTKSYAGSLNIHCRDDFALLPFHTYLYAGSLNITDRTTLHLTISPNIPMRGLLI